MLRDTHSVETLVGRYALHGEIASGGMATIHLGRLLGQVGFSRTVAIKRLHAQFAKDPEFVSMFLDEARLAGRIQHPNVVSTLDVVATKGEVFLVMEYVHGESFARLLRRQRACGDRPPPAIVASILCGALHGLHAAHEARSESGHPLDIVHRDVSPHNIVVGLDGVARVLDFGVAKAVGRLQTTREGQIKGKLAYMAPEQLRGTPVDRRVDVYAAAVVLWEAFAGRALFRGDNEGMLVTQVIEGAREPPSRYCAELPEQVDPIVMRGLALRPDDRWPSARELAVGLEDALGVASPRRVGEWVERLASKSLAKRAKLVEDIESVSSVAVAENVASEGTASTAPSLPTDTASDLSSISVAKPRLAGPLAHRGVKLGATVGVLALLGLVAALVGLTLREGPTDADAAGRDRAGRDSAGHDGGSALPSTDAGPLTPEPPHPGEEPTESATAAAPSSAPSVPDAGRAQPAPPKAPPKSGPVGRPGRLPPQPTSRPAVRFSKPD